MAAAWLGQGEHVRQLQSCTASTNDSVIEVSRATPAGSASDPVLRLLVVDAEPDVCRFIGDAATAQFTVARASSLKDALSQLQLNEFDIVLLDVALSPNGALTLLSEITASHPRTGVVVMTGFATAPDAMEAMRAGASDYLTKPFSTEDLRAVLERARQRVQRDFESRRLRERLRTDKGMGPLIGTSPAMERVYRILSKVALARHPALILGESGTGKEAVARAIHSMGSHAAKPFVVLDCGAFAAGAMEREIFGVAEGTITGIAAKEGLLNGALDGTVYLDNVDEMPLELQAKMLRVLQERQIRSQSAGEPMPFAARVLAASSADLMTMLVQGQFRKDLYFRLNVVKLRIPALRERREDIPMLAQYFLERLERGGRASCSFSNEALRLLSGYDWPGNVRELQSAVERMFSISSGPVLHSVDLPTQLQNFRAHLQADAAAAAEVEQVEAGGPAVISIAEMEKQAILNTIRQLNGDKLLAAKLLRIGKTTLYRKLKEYGEDC